MKTNIRIFMIMTALGVVFMCASGVFAQINLPMVGGFKAASVKDAKVVEAADFAISQVVEKSEMGVELVSIEKAEYQVVQGMNYRLCMQINVFESIAAMEDGADGDAGFVSALVYRNLKGVFSLTSATVVENCGKK